MNRNIVWFSVLLMLFSASSAADPYPPNWGGGSGAAVHYSPAAWPTEPVNAADCGDNCGQWKSYTRFQNSINDPRSNDDSNGGTTPQNYVNIASSCVDKAKPSIYYYLHQGVTEADDVIMFRWRVEQIANTYGTGPNAGSFSSSNPWGSALWTVLFDIDGSGYRSLAAHLDGSSGGPAESIDRLAGIWSQSPKQSIDYVNDPSVQLLGHNPTAFIDQGSGRILNFQSSLNPVASWPNGSSETVWDYGTSRARLISTRSCNEYFVDYQIPVAMLDATGLGGPKITRSTPISMMFCTANGLNNPFQKDCAINKQWAADSNKPAPFGDYISFDKTEAYSQPIVAEVTAVAPASCGQDYKLTSKVQDVLALANGEVQRSVKAVDFYYWYDANGSGDADEVGGEWVQAASAAKVATSLNSWSANWNASNLPKGRYLIGVQAVDDNTLVDNDMTPSGIDNRTFSYVAGNSQSQVYINDAWIAGQQTLFPNHNPDQLPSSAENWYGNPEVTGIQTALIGIALNTCGVAPSLSVAANVAEVAPGGDVTFNITVSNAGNSDAITVSSISNTLPDGFTYQSSSSTGDFGTTDPVISGQNLSWTFGSPVSVAPNSSALLNFTVTASSLAGSYNNSATASTSFGDDLISEPAAVAVGTAGLALSITPNTYSTSPSGQVTYSFNYNNPSTVAVAGVTLSSTLPADTTFQSCSDSCSSGATVSWSLVTVAPGETGSVSLLLDIDAGYSSNSLTTSASLSGTDPASNPISATAQNTIFVNVPVGAIAAFTLDKSASALQIAPGANVTYTLNYQNYGGASGSNIVITDTLPAGLTYVSCTGGASCGAASGIVTWNIGTVPSSATGSVTVIVTADNPFESPNPAVNTADINWDGGSAVSATANVGVTGLSCSAYYFRDSTISVGFDGSQRVATTLPVPLATDTGSSVSITAPTGATFLEAIRFYQNPSNPVDTDFTGTVDSWIYIDRSNGQGLNIQATLFDYNSITGTTTQLGQLDTLFNGSTKGRLDFSVPVSGTLQKDHRLLWVIGVRSNHASQTVDVQIQYNGTVTNAISGGTTFADSGADFCVTPPANLTIDKTVNLASVPESTTTAVVYTIDFANLGSSNATGVSIVDTLPAGVTFVSATLNGSPITPTGSNPYTFAVDTNGTAGTAVAGNSGVLLINASVSNSATGVLTNTATLSSNQTSAISDTADTLVGAPTSGGGPTAPEIYMSKVANSNLLGAGGTVTYTLTVVNAGNGDASTVMVTDNFPEQAYFSYVGCTTASGSCSETPTGTLSWNVGTLTAGGSAILTYSMQVASSGLPSGLTQLSNSADASDDDYCTGGTPPASCKSETVNVSISGNPDLVVSVSADSAAVVPGDLIEYTVVVTNNGSSTANDVSVSNPIPDNTGFVAITSGTGSFDLINNQVLFNASTLAAGASATYVFTVQVASPLPSGNTTITDVVSASAANAGSVTDTASSIASAAAVISVSLSAPQNVPLPATTLTADAVSSTLLSVTSAALLSPGDTLRVNGTFTVITGISANLLSVSAPVTATSGTNVELASNFSVAYQNTGNAAATNVSISQPLPAGWLYVSSSPLASSAPAVGSNGTLSWSLGSLDAGSSGSLQFVAIATASGSVTATATLTADAGINEAANASILVGGLTVQKTAASDSAELGGSVSYTILLSNSLASPVNGVQVTDILPAGFSYASSTTTPSDITDLNRPIWTVNVPASGSVSIDFTVNVGADLGAATYQNEVEVVAPVGVGVAKFDALATKSEDVTLLVNSGLMSGTVHYGSAPLSGVWVNFYENADTTPAYKVYTDTDGNYQQVLESASNWRLEISSDSDNNTLLAGLSLTTGTDPDSFMLSSGQSASRNFVYSLTEPSVNSQTTADTTPVITGTYPSSASGVVLSVTVNSVTYSPGADLQVSSDNWSLTIPAGNALGEATYEVTATVTSGSNSRSDSSNNELVVSSLDSDGDGISNSSDLDDDNDGIPDTLEGSGAVDTDGDGIVDSLDLDSDNDGLFDLVESGAPNVSTLDANDDGRIDNTNSVGSNGITDAIETTADSGTLSYNSGTTLDTDTDGIKDFRDLDSDNDGIPDVTESGGSDSDGDGIIGTGVPTVNGNGLATGAGLTPTDSDADGIGDQLELDADNNGIYDLVEAGGVDSNNDGLVDGFTDINNDGFDDGTAATPLPLTDSDSDGTPDYQDNDDADNDGVENDIDLDDDNDGIPDTLEGNNTVDTDGDGVADSRDLDSDNDGLFDLVESGVPNVSTLDANDDGRIDNTNSVGSNGITDAIETTADSGTLSYNSGTTLDTDTDGIKDFRDLDSDNDGIPDVTESGGSDPDGDGIIGTGVPTVNGNGLATGAGLTPTDSDADGIGDQLELDADNDGLYDLVEAGGVDSNNDGLVDGFTDINNDGFDDGLAATPLPLTDSDSDGTPDYQDSDDADNDGVPDSADLDDDNDGIPDSLEGSGAVDTDGDGIVDSLDLDSDNDGLFDLVESGAPNVSTLDVNNDGRIDNTNSVSSNGITDVIETSIDSGVLNYNAGSTLDTDNDGIEDFRDLDSDNDGIPDVTESGGSDPDGGGILGSGTPTVNNNGLANGAGSLPIDTDGDGLPDHLDLDADNDGKFDLVEAGGIDSNKDGRVDNFTDINGDGFDDVIAVTALLLTDTDGDNIPDYLDSVADSNNVIRTGLDGVGISNLWLLMLLMTLSTLLRRYTLKKLLGFGVLLSISFGANSAATGEDANKAFQKQIYIGAGFGSSLMEPETDGTIYSVKDENDVGYKLYVGFDLNQYISAELSMSDLGTTTLNPSGEIDYSISAFNALYYFYDQNENDHQGWASYIKGGLGSINNSANVPYKKENSVQVTLGAGIEYAWKNGLAARLDLESFDDDASLLSIGLLYRFGKRPDKRSEKKLEQQAEEQVDEKADEKVDEKVEPEDKDNIQDNNEECSNAVNHLGCEKDAVKEDIVDRLDTCLEIPDDEMLDEKACSTDNDEDGVLNKVDLCPDTVKGVTVNLTGCAILEINLEGVNFEINLAELTTDAKLVLDKAALALLQITTVRVEVQAHTDSVGNNQSNQKLSDARAISVADYLVSKGVKRDRLETKGYGETNPRASNETPEGRAKNRRVEFRVLSQKHMQ